MKNQIVLWAKNEKDEDILVSLRLRVEDRKVDLWTFKKSDIDEAFVEKMFEDWKGIEPSDFPQPFTHVEQEVSNTELLPENIRTTQTDLIVRAEKEWFFQVLAYQVFEQLKTEINAFSQQAKTLTNHSQNFWDEAVAFSNKIKDHAMARTLLRPQITELRKILDDSFEHLKKLMSLERKDFDGEANDNYDQVIAKINEYRTKIENNENFKDIFDNLKTYQKDLQEVKLKMAQRKDVWGKINEVFNLVKSKRGGQNSNRLDGRIAGLKKAIERMQRTVDIDKKDLDFHKNAVAKAGSRMEVQLREAKMQLLVTTLGSKQEKLDDMLATLADLETKLVQSNQPKPEKEPKIAAQPVNEIAQAAELKAADLVQANTEIANQIANEDAPVISTFVAEKTHTILEKAEQTTHKIDHEVEQKSSKIEEMIAKADHKIEDTTPQNDVLKAPAIQAIEAKLDQVQVEIDEVANIHPKVETITDKAIGITDNIKQSIEEKTGVSFDDLSQKSSEKFAEAKEKASEVADNLKQTIEEKTGMSFETMQDKGEEVLGDVVEKVSGFFSTLKGKAEKAFDSAHEYVAKKAEDAENKEDEKA